jgi:Uma2 family endonuclease
MTVTQLRLWTVDEYHRMLKAGILSPADRVELLDGQIVQMSPQLPPHAGTTQRIDKYLKNLFREQADIRVQLPITLVTSEPEPDIAVVRIDMTDYGDRHPAVSDVFLLIEVAHTSLELDRGQKSLIYARATIQDYWVVDVNRRQLYVYRYPSAEGYQSETVMDENSVLSALAFPAIEISLAQLLLPQ